MEKIQNSYFKTATFFLMLIYLIQLCNKLPGVFSPISWTKTITSLIRFFLCVTIRKIKPAISRFKKGPTRPYQSQKINSVTDSYHAAFGLFGKSLSLDLNELKNYCEHNLNLCGPELCYHYEVPL